MPRREHPLIVLTVESLAREFGVPPVDLWAWLDRKRPAPRWFVDAAVAAYHPGLRETDFDIDERLTARRQRSTLATMDTAPNAVLERKGRPLENVDQPLIAKLKSLGRTLTEEGKDPKVNRSRASLRSMVLDPSDPDYRPCPRRLAEHWQQKYGIPLSTWPRIRD